VENLVAFYDPDLVLDHRALGPEPITGRIGDRRTRASPECCYPRLEGAQHAAVCSGFRYSRARVSPVMSHIDVVLLSSEHRDPTLSFHD
jgi:hypothetical protein